MFEALLRRRWAETQAALHPLMVGASLSFEVGDYPHFHTSRGHAVTFGSEGCLHCTIRVAEKLIKAPKHRFDGVLRHELGHVVDIVVPASKLDAWAASRGRVLSTGIERRADDIAELIWGEKLRYDSDLVQSTKHGVYPRPVHLGL